MTHSLSYASPGQMQFIPGHIMYYTLHFSRLLRISEYRNAALETETTVTFCNMIMEAVKRVHGRILPPYTRTLRLLLFLLLSFFFALAVYFHCASGP